MKLEAPAFNPLSLALSTSKVGKETCADSSGLTGDAGLQRIAGCLLHPKNKIGMIGHNKNADHGDTLRTTMWRQARLHSRNADETQTFFFLNKLIKRLT
jgi:hypothetical protein